MSTATLGSVSPTEGSPWGEVARLCRRICTLRATGHSVEAARLQSAELSHALDTARAAADTNADVEARVRALFAAEEERVTNATLLADLLVPLLAERLRVETVQRARPATTAVAPALAPLPESKKPDRASPPSLPGIADFIDEMLDQERAAGPPQPRRRAS